MPKISIDKEKCKGCFLCVSFCPKGAVVPEEKLNRKGIKPAGFKKGAACLACAMCAVICPDCCITVYR